MKKKRVSKKTESKLKKIKLAAFDIDGILTDGKIFWSENSGWTRFFNVIDGYGIRLLKRAGFEVAFISGGDSRDIHERAKTLKIDHVYFGNEDKIIALEDLLKKTKLKPEQISYMGDELFDIPVLEKVGFAATVPSSAKAVKKVCDYETELRGGEGAAREVIEMILEANRGKK